MASLKVINEELIRSCVYIPPNYENLDKKTNEKTKVVREPPQLFEITCLMFSFKNIGRIQNLFGLDRLTKLQLDNNAIPKIENLSHLVNLEWLDLSFNQISKIEGLETLTKLTDLTLYSNKIKVIEGLDTLVNLQCFSVGRNEIKSLPNVLYLRRFDRLRMVTLAENEIGKDPEYKNYVLAHLKHLKYLDYRLVDQAAVNSARESYSEELGVLEEKERREQEERDHQAKEDEQETAMRAANLGGMRNLFEDLLKDEPDARVYTAFNYLIKEQWDKLHETYANLIDQFKATMLSQKEKKDTERADFQQVRSQLLSESEEDGRKLIKQFEATKKKVYAKIRTLDDYAAEVQYLHDENERLCEALLEAEMEKVEQMAYIMSDSRAGYEVVLLELAKTSEDTIQTLFKQLQLEEKAFAEEFSKLIETELETNPEGPPGDAPDASVAKQLLEEKDVLREALKNLSEHRDGKIYAKGQELEANEKQWLAKEIERIKTEEHKRNRSRVSEIWAIKQRNKKELEDEDF